MSGSTTPTNAIAPHGALELPLVTIDSYNLELRDQEGFIGDRASKRAFTAILDDLRERMRQIDHDPLGDVDTADLGKKTIDAILTKGDPEAAGVIHGCIEEFAQEMAGVLRRFTRVDGWKDTPRVVVGRRVSRQPRRRVGHWAHDGVAQSGGISSRPRSDPPPSRRGGFAWRAPTRPKVGVVRS